MKKTFILIVLVVFNMPTIFSQAVINNSHSLNRYKNINTKLKKKHQIISLLLFGFIINGCVEPFEFNQETFESALVIEATITNELKSQEIILSRTFEFGEEGPNPESGADVRIVDDTQGQFLFIENEAGIYVSTSPFSAQADKNYQLLITTNNGRSYSSTLTVLTQNTQIDELYAVRETNDDDINGMSIYVDSFDPTGNSKYYRYEYEETYKIVAPHWRPFKLIVVNDIFPDCEVALIVREQPEWVCYNTVESINLNLTATNGLIEDRVSQFLVRFLSSDDYIITTRYSILVKQYVISREAYVYFEALNAFSGQGSLFSQIQPGFLSGNIFSDNNPDEKVIGFFDVSTVSSKRLYFNYEDFYPLEAPPPFIVNCIPFAPTLFNATGTACGELISSLNSNRIVYIDENENPSISFPGPYLMVLRPCGECTALGSTIVPDFWEE